MKLVFGWTRTQIALCLGAFLFIVLSNLHLNTAPSQAQPVTTTAPPVMLMDGWQYHWGDFPLDDADLPLGSEEEILNSPGWRPFQFPQRLESHGKEVIWLRVPLPRGQWQFPMLYLRAVPQILGAYLENKLIYQQLTLNTAGKPSFANYQLPIIALEPSFQEKTLLFRVHTNRAPSIYIGLFDRVTVGSQTALVKQLLWQGIESIFSVLFTVLGVIAVVIAFKRQERDAYLWFGALTLLISSYTISRSDLASLFFDDFTGLKNLEYLSLYLIPVSGCLFFEQLFGSGYRAIIRRLWQVQLLYSAIALWLVVAIQQVNWSSTLPAAHLLFLISSLILLGSAIDYSLKGDWDAKLFALGFTIIILSAVNDILIYQLELANWYQKLYPWGTFVFILVLGFILERRFVEARRLLQAYTLELESKNADLKKLDQLKDEFLANTSHELKTPLNGIIGIADSLIDGVTGPLPEQTVSNLSLIVSEGKRLNQLVNDLLDFSQLKHKNIQLKTKPVGMREVTDVILRLFQPIAHQKSLQIFNKIDANTPPVDADENRVQQILYNLLGNAVKFTETGTVEVSAAVGSGELEITVADTGIGIPANKLDRVFESFEQADGSIAREYGGVGLGLAVTKQLVQLHGGAIRVDSKVGIGSRLTFTLPLSKGKVERKQPAELSKIQDFSDRIEAPDEALVAKVVTTPTSGAFKILIVDDEPVNLQVFVNYLSLENYDINQASSGMEALEIIRKGFKPDLILLDIMMPRMTGYEFCQKIREQFLANEVPVVLLTAKNQVSDLVAGFGAGANDYLTKPVSKNELLARIKTHIQLAKINIAYGRFVPHEFLRFLERESIVDVRLGDQVQKEMTVLFADIRSFTSLSEKMSPKDNFDFLNTCLGYISPVIRNHHGFIDKYIGDGIMALFPQTADDAVQAAIEMQHQVSLYNAYRQANGEVPVAIGIGLHIGNLMLGTVGESQRMETTVIADAVNLASRLEGLTKLYGVSVLISEQTLSRLANPQTYRYRFLGQVKVKGKTQPVGVFEICEGDPRLTELKMETRAEFERGATLFVERKFTEAQQVFQQVLQRNEQDQVVQIYIERCKKARVFGYSELNLTLS